MSQADELLDSLASVEVAAYPSETEAHIIIRANRFITVPDSLKRIAVQHDHNIETVTFDCPRYWDGIDMSTMQVLINYRRPDDTVGTSIASNVSVDETDSSMMHFDWTLTRHATEQAGKLSFLVCIKNIEDEDAANHWNSELNDEIYISEGLACQSVIVDLNAGTGISNLFAEIIGPMDDTPQYDLTIK